ncbi:PP2C family serine/threonine-protein phosphatase [Paeniglutamicibacter antarcticus]|uniref:PPM-type phosphatase domain-containing protein n=1 Tax=Paeniglutamicibacter antarcticus TaxID=494023 RepID=A0ABP9TN16_9MICC
MRYGFGYLRGTAATDIGLRRAVNEDAVLDAGTMFAVADGMGGHEAGDLASSLGLQSLNELALGGHATSETVSGRPGNVPALLPRARDVLAAVTTADARIRQAIGSRGGTTLCALALVRVEDGGSPWPRSQSSSPETSALPATSAPTPPVPTRTEALHPQIAAIGEPRYLDSTQESEDEPGAGHDVEPSTDVMPRAVIDAARAADPGTGVNPVANTSDKVTALPSPGTAPEDGTERLMLLNVGDSRGYRLRAGVLTQLTRDHSAVQELIDSGIISEAEARIHPQRNLITRALGTGGNSSPDTQFHIPRPGDRYLLCTDGLTGEVEHAAIQRILDQFPDRDEAVGKLIDEALASGGRDNISVVIVDIVAPGA